MTTFTFAAGALRLKDGRSSAGRLITRQLTNDPYNLDRGIAASLQVFKIFACSSSLVPKISMYFDTPHYIVDIFVMSDEVHGLTLGDGLASSQPRSESIETLWSTVSIMKITRL